MFEFNNALPDWQLDSHKINAINCAGVSVKILLDNDEIS